MFSFVTQLRMPDYKIKIEKKKNQDHTAIPKRN